MNQTQRAEALGLTLSSYSLLERGHERAPKAPTPDLGAILPHERCLIYRRRAGKTPAEVGGSEEMGYCRFTIHQMERGEHDCTDLLAYWEN